MGLNKADSDTTVENQQQQQLPQNNISPLPINIITQNKNSKINKKILKEKNSHTNVIINNNNNSSSITNNNNNSKKIFDLNHKPNDSNLGVGGKTTMAPALTEPLRSANQLTSSSSPNAASASPRPHTATTNTNSSKKNGNTRLLNEFPMGPMSEPNTNITDTTSSMGTNNFENIIENIPITLVHLENDFEEAISAEICMKGGVVLNNSKDKFINNVNNFNTNNTDTNTNNANAVIAAAADKQQESIDHMDLGPESDQITDNVHSNEPQHQQQQTEEPQNEQQQQRRQEPDLLLPSSPPASLASQHNIGSEEKLAGFDFKELPRISQDSTITASEGNDLDDNLSINSNPSPTKSCSQSNNQKESNSQTEDMDLEDIDLLNVFKNLESGNENLTDLAGSLNLFNDVMSYEDDISSSVISSSCVNTNSRISPTIVLESKELQADIKKMQRQIDFLNRRLRKLQTRNVCQQASEEISGLFEWSNRITRRKDYDPTRQAVHEEDIQRPVSAASMRSVLKKIDTISNQQRLISSKKKVGRPSSTPGPSVSVDKNQPLSTLIPQYDVKTIEEILQTAGSLQSELRLAEQGMDSDATLSSSGGESADENITYNNQTQQVAPIAKRAAWVYSCDRASIAAKWTWLLSQISDLEYKKRQHEELYQKLKSSKGAVALKMSCDEVSAKDVNIENEEEDSACRTRPFDRTAFRKRKLLQTANVHTISKKAARPSSVKCGCQWPLYPCALCTGRTDPTTPRDLPDTMLMQERASLLDNGFHPVLSFSNEKSYSIHFEATCNSYDWRSRCLRCTAKSAIKSVIAAQKAAIKSERSSMQSILPGFKKNEKGELVPKRKYKKKIQVPSDFYSDDGGGSGSSTPYPANKGSKSSKKHHSRNNHSGEQGHSSSMYHQNLNSTIPTSSSAQRNKIRKISSSTSFLNSSSISNNGNSFGGNDSFDNLMDSNLNGCRSRNSSPTHSYYRPSDKRSRNSYDIDNIVIPYSVAASTRVELLPYKEIPTPKWRMMDDDDFLLNPDEANEIINDFDKNSIDKLFDEFVTTCPNDKAENNIDGLLNISMSSSSCDITKPGIPNDSELDKSPDIQNNDTSSSSATPTTTINHPKTTTTTDTLNSPQVSESFSKSPLKMGCNINNNDGSTDDQQIEDTSDDAYALRHERGLQDERKKFATYLKFPFSTRSRANRRADSRTNSSGANTPDPSSPATTVPNIGVDQEPIPSPTMPPTPQTPFEGFENEPGTTTGGKKRNERKRTTSSKRDRERSSTPDLREIVPPFDPLQFPLPNEVYEEMLKMMPADHHTLDEYLPNNSTPVKEEEILPSMVPPLNGLTTGIMSNVNNSSGNIGGVCNNNNNSSNNSSIINISQNIKNSSTDLMGNIMFNNYANSTLIDSSTILNSSETLLDDSETESVETNTGEDDPNDPEWKGEAQ